MTESQLGTLPVLQSAMLTAMSGVQHLFTLRRAVRHDAPSDVVPRSTAGEAYDVYNMCDYTGDDPAHVAACRRALADAVGIDVGSLWFPRQVHGTTVAVVDSTTPPGAEADAVVTTERGLCIGVSTADCVPILLCHADAGVVAAVHAGWRGTVQHIVRLAVERLCDVGHCDAAGVRAAIGPSISPAAFEVGEEVAETFRRAGRGECIVGGYAKPHVDLWQSNVMDLLDSGVPLGNIDCSAPCSYGNADFLFSARRVGVKSGRTASCILLTKE